MKLAMIKMVITLTIVAALAGAILAKVYDGTKDAIAEAKRQEMLTAIKAVLPPFDNEPDKDVVSITSGKDKNGNDLQTVFYLGKKEGILVGIAFKTSTMEGYSGFIEIMVGVDSGGTISAIEILSHAETPGLGNKIVTPDFKNNFKGRNLENTKWLVKKDGGDIDQITGATISPRAVTKAVKSGLEFLKAHSGEVTG